MLLTDWKMESSWLGFISEAVQISDVRKHSNSREKQKKIFLTDVIYIIYIYLSKYIFIFIFKWKSPGDIVASKPVTANKVNVVDCRVSRICYFIC